MKKCFAVIGNPVEHSLSPKLYKAFVQQFPEIELTYKKILGDTAEGGFESQVKTFFSQGGSGLNVTVPFKQRAYDVVDIHTARAKCAGVVNSIFKLPDGSLEGDNTDGVGLLMDIEQNHQFLLQGKKILILGAGGAVQGILPMLLAAQPAEVVIANRTLEKARAIAAQYELVAASTYDTVPEYVFDLIINGTSLSLQGKRPIISELALSKNSLCYDMLYSKEPTPFMCWAITHSAQVAEGTGMLVEQGAENFRRWFGVSPETSSLLQTL